MPTQWHPLFADLLSPLLEDYYDVQTNVPVGDVPREADLVLLKKTSAGSSPFHGLWRHLKTWNILEFKGPSVSARVADLDLLVELGLGIHRRLNEELAKTKQKQVPAAQVCFWYIANHLGKRFRSAVEDKIGNLEIQDEGVWRGRALGKDILLVSGDAVLVQSDSLPLCVLRRSTTQKDVEVARFVFEHPTLWDLYLPYLETLHPEVLKEIETMARNTDKGPKLNLKPLIDFYGVDEAFKQVLDEADKKKDFSRLLDRLSVAQRAKLKRCLEKEPHG